MNNPIYSYQEPKDNASEYAARTFHILQLIARQSKVALVKVLSCSNNGDPSKSAGTVDVQKLLLQVDPTGKVITGTNGPIYLVPYWRYQAGNFAIVADPQPDDIGLCLFADQDISSVVAARNTAPVATPRINSLNDGLWICGFLNGPPEQYIAVDQNGGITIKTPYGVNINGLKIDANGNLTVPGTINSDGDITANANSGSPISLVSHLTSGVQGGSGTSGPPVSA